MLKGVFDEQDNRYRFEPLLRPVHALKGINLAFPAREITALIGPSGCGKSTLLKSLNRMNDLVEGCRITGSVKLDDQEIYGGMDVNTLRKRVGMVFRAQPPSHEHLRTTSPMAPGPTASAPG